MEADGFGTCSSEKNLLSYSIGLMSRLPSCTEFLLLDRATLFMAFLLYSMDLLFVFTEFFFYRVSPNYYFFMNVLPNLVVFFF